MKRVLTAVILIPLVVLALFKAPLWLFTLLVLGVALLAAKEYLDIASSAGFRPFRGLSYFFLVCGFALLTMSFLGDWRMLRNLGFGTVILGLVELVPLILSPFVFLFASLRRDPLSQALPDAAVSYMLLPYVGVTLACLVVLRAMGNGAMFVLYVMLLVWTGDIVAFYVGRAIGKHKLAPRVSPGKTWEGAIASAIGAILVAVTLFRFVMPVYKFLIRLHLVPTEGLATIKPAMVAARLVPAPIWIVITFAICVNIAAQVGDLVESAMKRGSGLKDSGSILPGHGGVLDRIDALLFAMPVALLFYCLGDFPNYLTARGFLVS